MQAPCASRAALLFLPLAFLLIATILPMQARGETRLLWERVRVAPGETNTLRLDPPPETASLHLRFLHPIGTTIGSLEVPAAESIAVPAPPFEGGFILEVRDSAGELLGRTVQSVCASPEFDVRYGFATNFGGSWDQSARRAEMLVEANVNAIEFYDFFAAHGDYTPESQSYKFEPFGVHLDARNVKAKQDAFRAAGIHSYAYVAPYAAAQSVFRLLPDPITGDDGEPLVYGPDHVKTTREYDRAGKSDGKWFTIMAMHRGSRWHEHVLTEYRNLLAGEQTVLAPFDGMEVDTYGIEERPYRAQGWDKPGWTIGQVLHLFMADTRALADAATPRALLTSNCVNGTGMKELAPFVDWQFMEIWPWGARTIEEYAGMMEEAGKLRGQRVVAKSYPDKMVPKHDVWPAENLRLMMGTAMLTGGSFMVAGEPNPKTGKMHSLKTDYYGNNSPLDDERWRILCAYNRFDALLYRITHGENVRRSASVIRTPGLMTRTFAAGESGLAITLLRARPDQEWMAPAIAASDLQPAELRLQWRTPAPRAVRFGSPDQPEWEAFIDVPTRLEEDRLYITVPPFARFGCVLIQR
ncbi:MAG: hypothetical protein PWP23_1996 [Candidatus Sumerlaeota bacterium]|nr:hypothetical protein [Candidatus Sumerlaeota bacterium]